jgi:murein DD-endopeptidase MepM/ murein hydrolase activator NlpD
VGNVFGWPLAGAIGSAYGRRHGRAHQGIDIRAPEGTPIRAAEAGRVSWSGRLGDYGNAVVLHHAGGYATVYAHARRTVVSYGQHVERGHVVAEVGATGNATGPHLHFEIRRRHRPLDPLLFLPAEP